MEKIPLRILIIICLILTAAGAVFLKLAFSLKEQIANTRDGRIAYELGEKLEVYYIIAGAFGFAPIALIVWFIRDKLDARERDSDKLPGDQPEPKIQKVI